MEVSELKEKVPYGYGKIIAERAGVTQKSVSMFFNRKLKSRRIEIVVLTVLAELKAEKEALIARI